MKACDFFKQKGSAISIEGNKPQLLTDPGKIWMVDQGKAAVFLTTLTAEDKPGVKSFLFEAQPGDLLFGITPEGHRNKAGLLASGLVGSRLLQLEKEQFRELLTQASSAEMTGMVEHWVKNLAKAAKQEDLPQVDITSEQLQLKQENMGTVLTMEQYHHQFLTSALAMWEKEKEEDKLRIQEKVKYNRRLMAKAISGLASIGQEDQEAGLEETAGDCLLDCCRLVGQAMKINIVSPPAGSPGGNNKDYLRDIARASRCRIRQVALKGEWYRQDAGPILGFLEEDHRPVALIPASPAQYILHDPFRGNKILVNQATSLKIEPFGFIFYRSFEHKKITLRDLLSFGYQSCWKRDLAMIAVMGALGGLIGTAVPLATGIIFDSIIPEGDKGKLLQVAFFLGSTALAAMFFQLTRSLAVLRVEGRMDGSLQASVWDRLLSLPVPFFKQFSAGELAMRAMGISHIRRILSGVTLNTILSSLFSVFTFALLFYYDTTLAGVAAVLVVIAALVMGTLGYWQVRFQHQILELSNKITGMVLQLIGGVTKFRVAGAENRAFYQWSKEFSRQRKAAFQGETVGNWLAAFNAVFPVVSSMVIFYMLTSRASTLSPGKFIAFNAAFSAFMGSIVSLSESVISVNIIIPLYEKAKPILEALPEYDEAKPDPGMLTGSIEVNHVSFRYKEDGPPVLQDVSLHIAEGEYVALVGTSGCGKSTLLRILLGFEQPEKGKVYYNGQDLSKVDIRGVRRQLGVVLQNGQLMSGNIFSNIVGANPYLTFDDAWEAARMAGLEQDIKEMPMGMHTVISEGAGTISGGQKQRLLIARAVVNKPKIIFFDEATSALDNRTQAIVSASLDKLQATRIVIAHRLSTVINCDRIIVMDRGKIVESGTYESLMKRDGIFARLAKRQLA